MKKHVVLLASAAAAPTLELIESLGSSGIAVRIEGLHDSELPGGDFSAESADSPRADPAAILYEIAPETAIEELRAVIAQTRKDVEATIQEFGLQLDQ